MNEVTRILSAIEQGEARASELLPLVYDELRKLAAQKLAQEKPGQTLQATALVHEAYLRLVVDQWQELVGRLLIASLDGREDAGDFVHVGCSPGPSGRVAARTDAGATTLRTDSDEADHGAEVRPLG